MARLLGIIILILALVLFPPAALAVVSNNAVPGDSTYPIKRGLEDIIYAVASLNPNTQALFAKARSDRRFQEIVVLTSQGKGVSNSLNELVEQTKIAASKIDNVTDSSQKEKLISQLSESIAKYDAGLSQISKNAPQPVEPTPILTEISQIPPTTVPVIPSVVATSPISTPISTIAPTIAPTLPPIDTPVPTLVPTSVPPQIEPAPGDNGDIEKVRDELDKIKKKLEEDKKKDKEKDEDKGKEKEKKGNEGRKRD